MVIKTKDFDSVRWASAIKKLFDSLEMEVVEFEGISDYQGCGIFLLREDHWNNARWYVMSFSYGTCGGCDAFEDLNALERAKAWLDLTESFATEQDAREVYEESVSRCW